MKKNKPHFSFVVILIFLYSIWSTKIIAHPIAAVLSYVPYLVQTITQSLLALSLAAGYQANIKPTFPSYAEHQDILLHNNQIEKICLDVTRQTGLIIDPEFLSQLNAAGFHHDFAKIAHLLTHVQTKKDLLTPNLLQAISNTNNTINPHELVAGITAFIPDEQAVETKISYCATKVPPLNIQNKTVTRSNDISFLPEIADKNFCPSNTQVSRDITASDTIEAIPLQQYSALSLSQSIDQGSQFAEYNQQKAFHVVQDAVSSVLPYLTNAHERAFLRIQVAAYKEIVTNACRLGSDNKTIRAQMKIATQGLRLPGFLNEFSDVLKEKVATLCFNESGAWKGIETNNDLKTITKAMHPYQAMLDTLSNHFQHEKIYNSEQCIETLYTMDTGIGSIASRAAKWLYSFFDDQPSYGQIRSAILSNHYNKNLFTTLDLLDENKFEFARKSLEYLHKHAHSKNTTLAAQQLFKQYQTKVNEKYDKHYIPVIYQADPVYSLYKPDLAYMQTDDPRVALIHGHLAIRHSIYQSLLTQISSGKQPTGYEQEIIYSMIEKINDPIALIDSLHHLNSNDANSEIRQAYSFFYNSNGILNLFNLNERLHLYNVQIPPAINNPEHTDLRLALNKLLLVDVETAHGKQSIQHALNYLPYACNDDAYAKDYKNIILAITQAHTQPDFPLGVLALDTIEHPNLASSTFFNNKKDFCNVLLKAASKAAQEDLNECSFEKYAPLTTDQAWGCIKQVQDEMQKGNSIKAHALKDTYLQGYLDNQMPSQKIVAKFAALSSVIPIAGTIWWAASNQNQQPKDKAFLPVPIKTPNPEDDKDKNKKKNHGQLNLTPEELLELYEIVEKTKKRLLDEEFSPEYLAEIIEKVKDIKGGPESVRKLIKEIKNPNSNEGAVSGIWDELRRVKELIDRGRVVEEMNVMIEGREIDIITNDALIENKNCFWIKKILDENRNKMGQLKNIADRRNRIAELHSRKSIPESHKEWLTKKIIKFFEG